MLKYLYTWLHEQMSQPGEKKEYSAGYWQNLVRAAALKRCHSGQGRLLELGCGEGLFLLPLAQRHKDLELYGVDIWQDIIEKARKRLRECNVTNVSLFRADAAGLPFADNFFDSVICINMLFNLPSEAAVTACFKEAARVCRKGGRVIFDIRNSLNPLLYLKYKFARYYDDTVKNLPLKTYRENRIRHILEAHSLEVADRVYVAFPHNAFSPVIVIEAKKE